MSRHFWTHPSVLALAGKDDPVEAVLARAREMVFEAVENGWTGPPFDPFELARRRNLHVVPREDVGEARLVERNGQLEVDYNPLKPRTRIRYSIAHEVAHTIFPDFAQKARYRHSPQRERGDEWQLEILCNLAAAEFLMPVSTLPDVAQLQPSIDHIREWRKKYEVSTETALLRLLRFASGKLVVFSASTKDGSRYSFNYVLNQSGAMNDLYGQTLRTTSPVADCTAIGFTAKGEDAWPDLGQTHVECVGIAPYPGTAYPRVVGLARTRRASEPAPTIELKELRGDATRPRGTGPRLLVHVVNDKARSWGAGFGKQVASKYPEAARKFREHLERGHRVQLGDIFTTTVGEGLTIVQLIAQHGYGTSEGPRLRYMALRESLKQVATLAKRENAAVHMPPIGTGFGGGSWTLIRELIEQELSRRGIEVTVYSIQEQPKAPSRQGLLF